MRSLNRPMFKMGGPIKEGVMHELENLMQEVLLLGVIRLEYLWVIEQDSRTLLFGQNLRLNTILKILHLLKNLYKE